MSDAAPVPGPPALRVRVREAGACPVLRAGDEWLQAGREVRPDGPRARLCLDALVAVGRDGGPRPATCTSCGARLDVLAPGEPAVTLPAADAAAPFLARLPGPIAAALVAAGAPRRVAAGEVLLDEGEVGSSLYLVRSGEVEVARRGPGGVETRLARLGPGECFGEMSLLTGEPTSAAVRAAGDAEVLAIGRDALEECLASSPLLSVAFSQLLASRLRAVNRSVERARDRGIVGRLSMISAVDLVQTLAASRRTGVLTVSGEGRDARLWFRAGRVVGARTPDHAGEEAFHELATRREGEFCFTPAAEVAPEGPIDVETLELVLAAMQRLDEAGA